MSSEMWWYVARSGGLMAWVAATLALVCGLLATSGVGRSRLGEDDLRELQGFFGVVASVFLASHLVGMVMTTEPGTALDAKALVVPGAATTDVGPITLGIVAGVLLVVVAARHYLNDRWAARLAGSGRIASYGVVAVGGVHAVALGSDTTSSAVLVPALVLLAAVVALTVRTARTARTVRTARTARTVRTARTARTADPGRGAAPDAAVDATMEPPIVLGELDVISLPIDLGPAARPLPAASVLERTLERLHEFDISAYPTTVLPPRLLAPRPEPAAQPGPLPGSRSRLAPHPVPDTVPESFDTAPLVEPPGAPGPLPTRTPTRLVATTAPARNLLDWQPERGGLATRTDGPPAPPEADPVTGEPDAEAYRAWLKDWLAYVEAYDG